MVATDRRRAENAAGAEDARDLGKRPGTIRDVKKHVIRDHDVEAAIREGPLTITGDGPPWIRATTIVARA